MSNGISDTQNPQATIKHLRALLAPLLDDPLRYHSAKHWYCLFCEVANRPGSPGFDAPAFPHAPTCPVLERDHILGR